MKKISFLILAFLFGRIKFCYSQENIFSNETINYCKISDKNIRIVIEQYLTRSGIRQAKEKGVVVLKIPTLRYDTTNFKFCVSEISKRSELKENRPSAFSYITGFPILIYGNPDAFTCKKKKYKYFYNYFSKKYLINDSDTKVKNNFADLQSSTFDPEILEITVHQDSIASRKELSKRLELKK
jgi:hypothetical protein